MFSIIVPAFNSESYIDKCLSSIDRQTLKSFQLIVVNDGSTDRTQEKLIEWQGKGLIDVLINQENKGVSEARNSGLAHVNSDYVIFVDSDDELRCDALLLLRDSIIANQLDVCLFDAEIVYDEVEKLNSSTSSYVRSHRCYDKVMSGRQFFEYSIIDRKYNVSPCMYAASAKFYKQGIRFEPGIVAEDNIVTTDVLLHKDALRCLAIKQSLYLRRYRPGSLVSEANLYYYYKSYLKVFDVLLKHDNYYASIFRGRILALASKNLAKASVGLNLKIKGRFVLIIRVIKNPSVLSIQLVVSLLFPRFYAKYSSSIKKAIGGF